MRMGRLARSMSVMLCVSVLAACGGPSKREDERGDVTVAKGLLEGRVFDADTGRALAEVHVKTPSGAQVKTDPDGRFKFTSESDTKRLDLAKPDYASTTKEAVSEAKVEIFIKPVETQAQFEAERGATVQLKSGGSLDIPPGAVTDREGKAVSGMVMVQVASVSGRKREQSAALPQSDGINREGARGKVGIAYAVDIKLTDAAGSPLSVRDDAQVVVELPALAADAPEKQSGFSFDEKQGVWVQEKDVTRVSDDRGTRVYRKDIDHLSWHGFGEFFGQLGCLRACVQSVDGAPVAGAQIWLVGSSYSGVSSLFTGSDGCVVGEVPVAQEVVLSAQGGGRASAPLRHVTSAAAQSAAQDPAACDTVAPLVLTQQGADECPLGFALCGDTCVDTSADREHCGSCGTTCGGTAGHEQRCVAGVCACPHGQTLCGDLCVNFRADPDHCGACNARCGSGDACVAMACVSATACEPGFTRCDRDCVDLSHSEARCGSCDNTCRAGELCLSVCVAPVAPALCSNSASQSCDDGVFCNGVAACNPASNQALSNGCVPAAAPCGAGQCDEARDQCVSEPVIEPTADAGVSCSPSEQQVALSDGPVDVVIALDTSGSMVDNFCNNVASLTAFMNALGSQVRVVTLYDLGLFANGCGSPDPIAETAIAQDALRYRHLMVALDSFNPLDQLLAQHANYGSFLRPAAATHFVVVTNDNSASSAASFKTQMDTLLGHSFVFNAMVADGQNGCVGALVGTEYLTLADLTAGKKLSVCSTSPSAVGAELQASVQASSASSCRVTQVTAAPELVQLFFQPSAGTKSQLARAVDGPSCGANVAWYYEGTSVDLCPAACAQARQGGQLSLGTGCAPLRL